MIKKSLSILAIAFIALFAVSCSDPEPVELQNHTITLDFTNAYPYHHDVEAMITYCEFDQESDGYYDTIIMCDITENEPVYTITANEKSSLHHCTLRYVSDSFGDKSFNILFGSSSGMDKTSEIEFDRDRSYFWNDNAAYMVLKEN